MGRQPAEDDAGFGLVSHCGKRQHQFGTFGDGYPRPVGNAAHPQPFDHEFLPLPLDAALGLRAGHGTAQDRIEPVHGKTGFGHVEQVRPLPNGCTEALECIGPARPGPPQFGGDRTGALQAHVDRAAAGEQCHGIDLALGADRPAALAAGPLETDREVNRPFNGAPHLLEELTLPGDQPEVIDPHGDIGAQVGFAGPVFGDAVAIGGKPAAVGQLFGSHPGIGPFGRFQAAAHRKPHGGFNVVPGVGFVSPGPGNFTGRQLGRGDLATDGADVDGRSFLVFTDYHIITLNRLVLNRLDRDPSSATPNAIVR